MDRQMVVWEEGWVWRHADRVLRLDVICPCEVERTIDLDLSLDLSLNWNWNGKDQGWSLERGRVSLDGKEK